MQCKAIARESTKKVVKRSRGSSEEAWFMVSKGFNIYMVRGLVYRLLGLRLMDRFNIYHIGLKVDYTSNKIEGLSYMI